MALMSANDLHHSPLGGLGTRVVHLLARKAGEWHEARRRRHSLAALQRLENWQLDDAGFTRGEVDWAMELPLYINAAHSLSEHAARRRADEVAALHPAATGLGKLRRLSRTRPQR